MSNSLQPRGLQHTRPPCPSIFWSLPKFMSIELVLPSNHLILCCPLLLSTFPSIRSFPMSRLFSWSFSFSASPSSEYSELISFRVDWSDLLAVQRTLKSLLQHHNSKASILQHSCPYLTVELFIDFSAFSLSFFSSLWFDWLGKMGLLSPLWVSYLWFGIEAPG